MPDEVNQDIYGFNESMKPEFAFPTLEQLSDVTADDLKNLGFGYRSTYIIKSIN